MLNVGIIGCGNGGNQVATLGMERLGIPAIAINSSSKDMETLSGDIPKVLIQNQDGTSKEGAGQDRSLAKLYLKDSIMDFIQSETLVEFIKGLDIVFVVGTTGGGTGSATAPILTSILKEVYKNKETSFILIGIMPVLTSAPAYQVNTLEYLKEIYENMLGLTYMLYDNDRYSDMSSYKALDTVNSEIISDINVLRCYYNYTTKYDSIDDRDAIRLDSTPGRLFVARLEDFKEKDLDTVSIEDLLIDKIKKNAHAELQRDKKIESIGIIVNLAQSIVEDFNDNLPKIVDFIGCPNRQFKHIYVNDDRKMGNNVFLILGGLSPVNDRVHKIEDQIEEAQNKQNVEDEGNAISNIDVKSLTEKISTDNVAHTPDMSNVDISSIFDKFNA